MDWPTEDAINNTAHNGECDAPTYKIDNTLWRISPAGLYGLYWRKGSWRVSGYMTNADVKLKGALQK